MKKVPPEVKKLFWEYKEIDGEKNKNLVVGRIMEMGNDVQVEWMLSNYLVGDLGDILKSSKNISPKSANYWAKYFGYSFEEVECLKRQLPAKQNRFG